MEVRLRCGEPADGRLPSHRFLDDGDDEIAEYDGTKTLVTRIIPGPFGGGDEKMFGRRQRWLCRHHAHVI